MGYRKTPSCSDDSAEGSPWHRWGEGGTRHGWMEISGKRKNPPALTTVSWLALGGGGALFQ